MLFTSVPVNALSAGETNTEQQMLDELNTENKVSTEESNALQHTLSNASSTDSVAVQDIPVATDSNELNEENLIEETSSEDVQSNDNLEESISERTTLYSEELSSSDMDFSEQITNSQIELQGDSSEEDEEPSNDNWGLSTVFYDSTVNNGKTPLTSIDWDASDGSYKAGTPRVVTVQINYKNSNAATTYQPGDVEIAIPNLTYCNSWSSGSGGVTNIFGSGSAQWKSQIIVGANDSTHTGYDWDFKAFKYGSSNYTSPNNFAENLVFTNNKIIEEKSNFEGSIQIVYTITPCAESQQYEHNIDQVYIEKHDDSCVHEYSTNFKASIIVRKQIDDESNIISSPNYPDNYNKNIKEEDYLWEYRLENAKRLDISFSDDTDIGSYNYVYFYNKENELIKKTRSKSDLISINDNYAKITMSSGIWYGGKWKITINPWIVVAESNALDFHYIRTYTHPWKKDTYYLRKSANKILSYDGLPQNADEYIWVKYNMNFDYGYSYYPNIGLHKQLEHNIEIRDNIPEGCLVYDVDGNELSPRYDNTYVFDYNLYSSNRGSHYNTSFSIYVGYPKEIYNEENNNLIVENVADYYGVYASETEFEYITQGKARVNLADYRFSYSGNLYGITKQSGAHSNGFRYQDIVAESAGDSNQSSWWLHPQARYTGTPMTVKIGDDLLYATDKNEEYKKINDEDYYFTQIDMPLLKNGNKETIKAGSVNCELWVRHAGNKEFSLYEEFTNYNGGNDTSGRYKDRWYFTKEDKVVGWYFLIKDLKCSLDQSSDSFSCYMKFIKKDIPQNGTLYNFGNLEVYFKNEQGDLVLQNEPDRSSYDSFVSQEIANFDIETYGHYIQRCVGDDEWTYYKPTIYQRISARKQSSGNIKQDVENERFTGAFNIGIGAYVMEYHELYKNEYDKEMALYGFSLYDLLPKGMELLSSEEEIINSLTFSTSQIGSSSGTTYKNIDFENCNMKELHQYGRENTKIEITQNWNNTGRTRIKITLDLSENPIFLTNNSSYGESPISYNIKYSVSYDSYLEYGNVWTNRCYAEWTDQPMLETKIKRSYSQDDNGAADIEEKDINGNGETTDKISRASEVVTITSAVSSHQDVQTQVQTVNDNFTVGKGTSPYNEEYTYKLRVRTGQNAATNMVIANNLEMAYRDKKFWQGEFKGIDTSYIENKTWMVYDPKNENANSDGYVPKKIIVKPYYSTNPEETDLYLTEQTIVTEDGIEVSKTIFKEDENGNILKNTNWKEYTDDVDKGTVKSLAFELLDAETGKPAVIPANSLLYVLVKMQAPDDPYEGDDSIDQSKRPLSKDIKTYAYNNCWTQWNPIDETFNTKVDFVTGIHSNIVRVALPYTAEDDPIINLNFIKVIDGTEEAFEKLQLKKGDAYKFQITLTNQETGDIIQGILDSKTGLQIKEIPIGTYLITESDDIYFDFVDMTADMVDAITFENTENGYLLTIDNTISEDTTFEITVNNKIEPDRPYEDKKEKINLFKFF